MSHFTVLVVGEDPERKLAPYHEFECTGRDEYVQDIDKTAELREDFGKHTATRLKDPDGKLHDFFDEEGNWRTEFSQPDPTASSWDSNRRTYFVPIGYEKVEVPAKDVQSFADFIDGWSGQKVVPFGQTPNLSGEHKYGYVLTDEAGSVLKVIDRTNPNRKWDWYELGGRWTGYFRMKPNTTGVLGDPGLMTKPGQPGFADQCKKGDIDLVVMRAEARMKAAEKYDKFQAVLAGRDLPPRWSAICDKHPKDIDAARKEYGDISVVRDIRKADLDPWGKDIMDVYGVSKEEFCQRAEDACFSTFAIIDNDGKWHEKGEMGWFGMAHNEKCQDDWNAVFRAFFDAIPDDTIVSVYDCHI